MIKFILGLIVILLYLYSTYWVGRLAIGEKEANDKPLSAIGVGLLIEVGLIAIVGICYNIGDCIL